MVPIQNKYAYYDGKAGMKTHYSAADLAALKLPGLPGTARGIEKMSARQNLPYRDVPGKGGKSGTRREYAFLALPEAARLALAEAAQPPLPAVVAPALPALVPAVQKPSTALALTTPQPLKTSQIDAEVARDRLARFIDDFDGSINRAIDHLNVGFVADTLPGPLRWAMDNAWNKPRSDCRLTRDTYNKWQSLKKQRGRSAPLVRQKDMDVKPWHALAIALKQRPQGTCLTYITEQIEAHWKPTWGDDKPSYNTIRRFFSEKFSRIDQLKGRLTGSALSPHKHFTKRTSVGMLPWDEIHADGWNTHFTAPHPITGEYVTYEVWHAHDVATRWVPPFGVGLTENFEVIQKCVENAVRAGGCMTFLQTDSTKIVKDSKRFKTDPATALADRVGFTVVHPQTVGNSQANGIAENFNAWMDRECRELATYQAKGMDGLTLKRVKKLTAKAVRLNKGGDHEGYAQALVEAERMGKGRVVKSYAETLDWLEAKRLKWNAKPHQALPKIRDENTGKLRHQSPDEALQLARVNGWEPDLFKEEYLVAMFYTHCICKVRREAVTPYGGMRYHESSLGDWNGLDVVVSYDIMDWSRVWVKTLKGEPICEAKFSEATGYRTATAKEIADEKRAVAQIKHREKQIVNIRERVGNGGMGGEAIEGECSTLPENQSLLAFSAEEIAEFDGDARRLKKNPCFEDTITWLHGPSGDEETSKEEAAV